MKHYLLSGKMTIISILLFSLAGCNKFLDVPPSNTQLSADKVYSNATLANEARSGLYADIMSGPGILNGLVSVYAGYSSDELITGNAGPDTAFTLNNLSADNKIVKAVWESGYGSVHDANVMIERLGNSTALPDSLRTHMLGEAKFIRGLAYFGLVNLFGDVPLVLATDVNKTGVQPRTPVNKVYQQILADLTDAQAGLPAFYGNNDSLPNSRIWITSRAATAMLARIYLFMGDWTNAERQASLIIDGGAFRLADNPNQAFLFTSPETILQFSPLPELSYNTQEGALMLPLSPGSPPPCLLTDSLVNAFEPGDTRKEAWLKSTIINGRNCYYPYKYKVNKGGPPFTEYNVVLRLAEQYVVRAEARVQMGKLNEAAQDLNIVRKRANLPLLPLPLTQLQLMKAVIQERRVELFAEWGFRWFDLIRWPSQQHPGKKSADDVLFAAKGSHWSPDKVRWPIPASELLLNKNLVQNPGY